MNAPTYLAPVRDEIARLRAAVALLTDTLARRSEALNRTGRDNDHLRAIVAACPTCRTSLDPTSPTAIREPK